VSFIVLLIIITMIMIVIGFIAYVIVKLRRQRKRGQDNTSSIYAAPNDNEVE